MGNIHEDDACFYHFRNDWNKVLGGFVVVLVFDSRFTKKDGGREEDQRFRHYCD
jgi:hypothetical protein